MSTDPKTAPDEDDDALARQAFDEDDPLVARLHALRWPQADDQTRERALERFRTLIAERERPNPDSAGD